MHLTPEFPCPCCGYLVFNLPPGYHGSCPICRWEDDLAQLRFPLMPGSSNRVSLIEAQRNFSNYGSVDRFHIRDTRKPELGDMRESGWRPLNEDLDNIEEPQRGIDYSCNYPQDTTVLYYWRETYWRSGKRC